VKRSNSVIGWPSLLDPVKLVRRGRRTICLTRYLGAEFVPERRARPRERVLKLVVQDQFELQAHS
jgi:hypothetical protein